MPRRDVAGYYPPFPVAIPSPGLVTDALLTLSPLAPLRDPFDLHA